MSNLSILRYWILSSVLFIASCETTNVNRKHNNQLQQANEYTGYIAGTLITNCKVLRKTTRKRNVFCRAPFRHMGIAFRSQDKTYQDELAIIKGGWIDTSIDYQNNDIRKVYFCMPLRAGNYDFNEAKFSTSDLIIGGRDFDLEPKFLAPFTVSKKQITYVGTILLKASPGQYGDIGSPDDLNKIYAPESVSIKDEWQESQQKILQKCPALASNLPVIKQIPLFGGKSNKVDFYVNRHYFYSTPPYYKPFGSADN